ncbi:hypothetical protein GMLC_17090 [Geomonas limicola]|uniref:Lipoprotein n=1 Tax=Geomonas limicola TaxID=2740186 RepID=A0A6V8N700_9BACT|nr:hypothetical protein [Geomonas limicola]GFO68130.1 hypothetical protein GMLC_17090 [Geomonas limicola]
MRRGILRLGVAMIMAVLVGACATANYPDVSRQRMASLPEHYTQFDLQLAWSTRSVADHTVVEGIVRNVRWAHLYDLEIWVAILGPDGKEAARSVSYVIPRQLDQDRAAPFSVQLSRPAPAGSKLRFTYRYRGSDGGDEFRESGAGGMLWVQSFEATVP